MAPERDSPVEWRSTRCLTILFVEDEVLVRFAAADLMRSHGHEVIEAASGAEALSLIDSGLETDLLVSDVRMPGGIDGLQLIQLVKARRPGLPVILASAHLPEAAIPNLRFLRKPYSDAALLDAVQEAVNKDEGR